VRPDRFDAAFFRISKAEAAGMDPQQRMVLEVAWEAIESAGIAAPKLAGSDAGVFLASSSNEYAALSLADPLRINAYSLTGSLHSFLANRLSYFLDLRGPSLVVDTACSSSLMAIHLACQSLRQKECGAALAGGVSLTLLPNTFIAMSKAWLLSATGRCHSFDAAGDGYVRSDGCGVVVLKRLADALRDGDPVRAVIRGSAANQNGRGNSLAASGITAPSAEAIESVVRQSLRNARLSPADIDFIEAHGVGSVLADATEISALARVFEDGGGRARPVLLGSVKTNIGHLEAASGIASTIGVVMSLERERYRGHPRLSEPNAALKAHLSTFLVPRQSEPWAAIPDRRRRAGINSFGIGGTNVHLVLEEGPERQPGGSEANEPLLFPISAQDAAALDELIVRYIDFLDAHPSTPLEDICGTAAVGRTQLAIRRVVIAQSVRELREKLAAREFAVDDREVVDPPRTFNRIALPTYPFRPTRHWLGADVTETNELERKIRQVAPEHRLRALTEYVLEEMEGLLGTRPPNAGRGFFELGMNSLMSIELVNRLQRALGSSHRLPATLLFERPTPEALVDYLARDVFSLDPKTTQPIAAAPSAVEPVAIIGMACRFPGADTPDEFWKLLIEGREAIGPVPGDRWNVDAFYDADPAAPGKTNVHSGGFLTHVDLFDAEFFNIMPREASAMDPQQRLVLEVAEEALENAGAAGDDCATGRVGVFVGASSNDHMMMTFMGGLSGIDAYAGTGNLSSALAGRLSFLLGLRGPSLTVDTACSSSLVAVHLACQSLRSGESNLALAGGVNVMLTPEAAVFLTKARALAADGRCKVFDASADGYGRGEGCGLVVLRRLSDAVASGDRILAVIRGTAVNHDGRSSGFTVPSGIAQQEVIRKAIENAGIGGSHVAYVEAHGTGTALGDPIEARALAGALRSEDRAQPLIVGSAKTNIGHLEAAAGVAGLIKVVLSLQHERIPANLNFREMNPHIAAEGISIRVPTEPMAWPRLADRRIAGVSSFGLTGTNAHVVVEEALEATARTPMASSWHLLALSARTPAALRELTAKMVTHIRAYPELSLEQLCFTNNTGRRHHAERLAVVAGSREEMLARLEGRNWPEPSESDTERSKLLRLSEEYLAAMPVDWRTLYEGAGFRKVALPTYPFQRQLFRLRDKARPQANPETLYEFRWEHVPAGPTSRGWAGQWLILADTFGLGRALAAELQTRGAQCAVVEPGEVFSAAGRNVVHLWALDATPLEHRTGCGSLLDVLQQSPARIWVITANARRVAGTPALPEVAQASIWGLSKGIRLEHPELWGGLIDTDTDDVGSIITELGQAESADVALRDQKRYIARLVHARVPAVAPRQLSAEGSYLITGGLGGLGLEVADYLVGAGARKLVLVGRRDPSVQALEKLARLEAAGASVSVLRRDISDAEQVRALVEAIPDLRGVIHSAGTLADGVLLRQTWDRFETVLGGKARGAWHLHEATSKRDLEFFVMFSSAASLEGSPGQANHSAANAFLDGLAEYRQGLGLPGLSINWGPWAGIGKAAEYDPGQLALRAGKFGLGSLDPGSAIATFGLLLHDPRAQIAVLRFLTTPEEAGAGRVKTADTVLLNQLRTAASRERHDILSRFVSLEVARITGFSASQLPADRPLFDGCGLDSLMALELRNSLGGALGRTLPSTLIFEYPTIEAMARYLAGDFFAGTAGSVTPKKARVRERVFERSSGAEKSCEARLREMSDEEAEALLLARLPAFERYLETTR
jgi:acyl transferase domain-containing protein/acyl carrier protein